MSQPTDSIPTSGHDEPVEDRRPGVFGQGRWVTAVGQVLGNLVVSLVVGDALKDAAEGARSWRVWNWLPFLVVLGLGGTALLRTKGSSEQLLWVCLMLGVAVTAALVRVAGFRHPAAVAALVSALSVALAAGAVVRAEYLREHGEVDVKGRTTVSPSRSLTDGETLDVMVRGTQARTHLRLVLSVADAHEDTDFCTPDTTLDVGPGGGRPPVIGVRSGEVVDLALGGSRPDAQVRVTVRTSPGCQMHVTVRDAVLHG
ncbi:hypothetical protein [Streptomyces caniscabiei]|uniref:Integral membrane protein n=1 Tax=Streptomyces caniscabiei TaxID=2746961 RepID=A0ABU4MST7_9ACTN|nr:hypothetical protein [Streptomyces caniscabiei]MBE4740859.1 hypothetical protein [Streptomyces caniscabiei]MBE4759816.1 hypothetical protein [Streptomyces caniscabiei]MBE4789151.1 hypothetical protein [Streptomyces caniscabiei]MBE4794659.1 hypothetical protein [Streptomyces caniscabiei]MDX2941409.1 hypothetical protein [Streptomyces caniscabiei]